MSQYSGNLSIYFPCQLKGRKPLRWFHDKWNRCRDRQVRDVHMRKAPLTDLMDLECYRTEKENLLKIVQGKVVGHINLDSAPYALTCLSQAYRKVREDNLFSKNASVLISHFDLSYYSDSSKTEEPIKLTGNLVYNVNADNNIATYIVMLHFKDLSADDIIMLKHIFYKRLEVTICEYDVCYRKCNSNPWVEDSCFSCISKLNRGNTRNYNSFQEYIAEKDMSQRLLEKYDVDFRARYSLVELDNLYLYKSDYKEYYGIMCADEGYQFLSSHKQERVFEHNLSIREDYGYYQCGLDGLIVNKNKRKRVLCKERHAGFEYKYREHHSHIQTSPICCHCVAGVQEEFFPAFLKAVELHFLINNVLTSETEHNDRSYLNPIIFIKRGFKLWNILYDLDVNHYHIHSEMHNAFGIRDLIEEIREEYKSILQHTMSYVVILFTIVQILIAIIK